GAAAACRPWHRSSCFPGSRYPPLRRSPYPCFLSRCQPFLTRPPWGILQPCPPLFCQELDTGLRVQSGSGGPATLLQVDVTLQYPQCLHMLELLQYEHFRKELVNAQCAKFIDEQQILHWQHYSRKRMRLQQALAEQQQQNNAAGK
uniref:Mediator of RNA polymerase II transcription subunit 31 n=1 Tax=Felis catus TaxID=9685 RepID=A0ABI8ADN3_FELCA